MPSKLLTAVVLTVSDSSFRGERPDVSGPAVAALLKEKGFAVAANQIVPDEQQRIEQTLIRLANETRLIITTGGTGIGERDVTPEATRAVCERLIEGIPEKMRSEGTKKTPFAALSRGLCGTRGQSLILNLPGSPKGAVESLASVVDLLPHALDLIAGKTEHQGDPAQV